MTGVGFKKANKDKDRAEGDRNPMTDINAGTGLYYRDLAMTQIEMMDWTWQEGIDLLEGEAIKIFHFLQIFKSMFELLAAMKRRKMADL